MNIINSLTLLMLSFYLVPASTLAQVPDTSHSNFYDFGGVILMDSIVVSASKTGFNVADFIDIVRKDESFYQAFRNIRTLSYSAHNKIQMYTKKQRLKAYYENSIKQHSNGTCRSMRILSDTVSGNFYKRKGRLRYYTSKLFDQLFFTKDTICEHHTSIKQQVPKKGMRKHIHELKKLIFTPGEQADVPMIGKKTAIFSEKMAKYYDYTIRSEWYKDKVDCYVFSAVVKPEFQTRKADKTVIKSLHTYFDKENFQVIARSYQLKYYGALFDFDVKMKIELEKLDDLYVPVYLEYDGFWDIPTKKPEISRFHARFFDYQIPNRSAEKTQ